MACPTCRGQEFQPQRRRPVGHCPRRLCLPSHVFVLVDRHRCGLSVSLAAPLTDDLASGFHRQPCHPSTLHLSLRVSPPVPQLSLCVRPSSLQAQPPPMSLCTVLFFSSNLLQTKHGRDGPASRLPSAGGRGSAVQLSLLAQRHCSMTPMPPSSLMQLSDLQPKRPSGLGRLGAFCTTQGHGRGRESH